MSEDFEPSPSLDSHTTPMTIEEPLIKPVSNPEDTAKPLLIVEEGNKPKPKPNQSKALNKLYNVSELKSIDLYQALLSEFIGTMLLTLVCTATGLPIMSKSIPDLHGALAGGLIVATVIVGFGHVSGAHINPAVTVSFLVSLEINVVRALLYIVMQLLGAISASAVIKLITPVHARGTLGMTMITNGISLTQAFVVELLITFILCYTVHAICDKKRDDIGGSKALAVGFAVTIGCLFGGPYTGASMNPARSFGPAVIMNNYKNHWIYWFGPLTGSIIAALVYTHVLQKHKQIVTRTNSRGSTKDLNL